MSINYLNDMFNLLLIDHMTIHVRILSPGTYAICLDNYYNRMSSKFVYLYLTTYVYDEVRDFSWAKQDMRKMVYNFTVSTI